MVCISVVSNQLIKKVCNVNKKEIVGNFEDYCSWLLVERIKSWFLPYKAL